MKQLLLLSTLFFISCRAMAQASANGQAVKREEIFVFVEQMPSFPGGEHALYQYLKDSLRYPEEAKRKGIEGIVHVKFIITETGVIKNPQSLRSADSSLSAEAVRLVSSMPPWKPGKQNGRAVSVYFTLPVSFRLE
ncbi:MAG: energy transducer TonB [Chitinophagaceae bacterium]|nr:energy transducer TonB [Chitinophagaceae bacterium]